MEVNSEKTPEERREPFDDRGLVLARNEKGSPSPSWGVPIEVAIVEEDLQSCWIQQHVVNQTDGYRCAGIYNCLRLARDGLIAAVPSILILDLLLPDGCGIAFARLLKSIMPKLAIIMVSGFDDEDLILQSLQAGALAFLVKPFHPSQLMATLKTVSILARRLAAGNTLEPLGTGSARDGTGLNSKEQIVMDYLTGGLLYKEIAAEMHLSEAVIRKHTHAIYHKLHVMNRAEAIGKWRIESWVQSGNPKQAGEH